MKTMQKKCPLCKLCKSFWFCILQHANHATSMSPSHGHGWAGPVAGRAAARRGGAGPRWAAPAARPPHHRQARPTARVCRPQGVFKGWTPREGKGSGGCGGWVCLPAPVAEWVLPEGGGSFKLRRQESIFSNLKPDPQRKGPSPPGGLGGAETPLPSLLKKIAGWPCRVHSPPWASLSPAVGLGKGGPAGHGHPAPGPSPDLPPSPSLPTRW